MNSLPLLLLWTVAMSSQVVENDAALVKFTRAQLEVAIQKTKREDTRLDGLHDLIRMAGPRLYEGSMISGDPDPEVFQLRGEAARATTTCRDVETVGKALDSPLRSVRTWAVLSFETRNEYKEAWHPLVPKLLKMLSDPDPGFRQLAVDKLWYYPEGKVAIADRARFETDPDVLLRMARSGSNPDLYRSLVRLLANSDEEVREGALSFIYFNLWNKATAPMWRLDFNQDVYDQVSTLSHSPSQRERESAQRALRELERMKQTGTR